MADDNNNNNKKKMLDNAGERAKGAFTGEDGSVFWACKEIYNALKVGVQALNVQLGKMGRIADESRQESKENEEPIEYRGGYDAEDAAFDATADAYDATRNIERRGDWTDLK